LVHAGVVGGAGVVVVGAGVVVEVDGTVDVEGSVVDGSLVDLVVVGLSVVVALVAGDEGATARRWPAEPPQAAVADTSPRVATMSAPILDRRAAALEVGLAPITAKTLPRRSLLGRSVRHEGQGDDGRAG